jgi:hypothetical protein
MGLRPSPRPRIPCRAMVAVVAAGSYYYNACVLASLTQGSACTEKKKKKATQKTSNRVASFDRGLWHAFSARVVSNGGY